MKVKLEEVEVKYENRSVFVKLEDGDEVEITEHKVICIRDNNGNTKFYLEW